MFYALEQLAPLGFSLVTGNDRQIVLQLGHTQLVFDCACPAYPEIKAMGCPLHHAGRGSSSPVCDAVVIAKALKIGLCVNPGDPNDPVIKFRNLALEAADALWALSKGKAPDRPPRDINQDIYQIRSLVDHKLGIPQKPSIVSLFL